MKDLILGFIKKASKVLTGGKEHKEKNHLIEAIKDIKKYLAGKIIKNPFEMIAKGYLDNIKKLNETVKSIDKTIDNKADEITKKIERFKNLVRTIKLLAKLIKFLIHLIAKAIAILPPLALIIVIIIAVVVLIMILASLFNLFSFSYGFDKTAYYDNKLFQAVKNKEVMEENIYERAGETSYYQRFVDAEIENLTGAVLPSYLLDGGNYNSTKSYKKEIEEAQKSFTGFYSLDSRLTVHDANFNNMSAFIQANTLDSNLQSSSTLQGFLRDYFNKEVNFELSSQFLMQLNNKAFAKNGMFKDMQLIYPEIFTKPVSYVYDFNRAELTRTVVSDNYEYKWKDYTYITQRITKEDIGKKLKDILVNYNELTWGKYYGEDVDAEYEIKASDEGKIFSWASPVVWEYVVSDKDDYRRFIDENNSATVTNDYNSEYLLFKNDETGEELIPKFYYLITGTSSGKFSSVGDGNDGTFAKAQNEYTFSTPYMGLNDNDITNVSISNIFNNKVTIVNNNGVEDINGKWYKINIPDGYRLTTDVSAKIQKEDGTTSSQARKIDYVLVSKDFNSKPEKHIQLANLIGEDGDVAVSSQNLINYKYFKVRTVSESYRNKQEYVDNWAAYIDANGDFLSSYADRNFWGAVMNRVSGAFGNLANSLLGIENNLEPLNDSEEQFTVVSSLPKDAINFSLYLYEKDFISKSKQQDNTWTYNYSVNNYFKTDNDKLDSLETFQKYFYIAEELIVIRNDDGSWNTESTSYNNLKRMYCELYNIDESLMTTAQEQYFKNVYLNDFYDKIVEEVDMNNVKDSQYARYIEMISNSMATKYMNLGTVKANDITGEIIGDTIYGSTRKGEVSLESTLKINDYLRSEMINFSALNGGVESTDSEDDIIRHEYKYKNAYDDFVSKVQNWFSSTFLGFNMSEEEAFVKVFVSVSREEHNHLQSDYYIKDENTDGNLNTYSSNVFKYSKTGDELPLELKSVRDYGLGSILNYVDSVVVEFKSGATYEEVYLKEQIGKEILSEYKDVYDTYSIQTKYDDAKSIDLVGEGYYPKEVKDMGGDVLIELFAQNNKKAFFENLVNTLDGKILEVSNEYDIACSDPEANRTITSLGITVDEDAKLNGLSNFEFSTGLEGQDTTTQIKLTLDGDGNIKINASSKTALNNIEKTFEDNQIYKIFESKSGATGVTNFKYYTPYLKSGATKLSQLLLPKRYYRSWLAKTDTLTDIVSQNDLLNLMFYYALGENIVTKETISEKDVVIKESIINDFESTYTMAKTNDIIEKKWYDFVSKSFTEGRYVSYLLDKAYNKKNFTEGLGGDYRFILEGDIKKVYLIDEVVTFAGKFMYTYKDTLLTTTESADETMPKSVIGAYATDRYVFLDSWDVKLLTDRIADVSFMFYNTEATIQGQTVANYIRNHNKSIFSQNSLVGYLEDEIKAYEADNSTAKTYIFAIPSNYINNKKVSTALDALFSNNDRSTTTNFYVENTLKEIEDFTVYISNGFLLSEAASENMTLDFSGTSSHGELLGYVDILSGITRWDKTNAIKTQLESRISNIESEMKANPAAYGFDVDITDEDVANFDGYKILQETTVSLISNTGAHEIVLADIKNQYSQMIIDIYSDLDISTIVTEDSPGVFNINYSELIKNVHDLSAVYSGPEGESSLEIHYSDKMYYTSMKSLDKTLKDTMKTYMKKLKDTNMLTLDNVRNGLLSEFQNELDYHLYMTINTSMNSFLAPDLEYSENTYDFSSIAVDGSIDKGGIFQAIFDAISSFIQGLRNKIGDVISGFQITSVYEVRTLKTKTVLAFDSNIDANSFKNLFNKYVTTLNVEELDGEEDDSFNFKYTFSNAQGGVLPEGTGVCNVSKKYYKYTLKISDEIANTLSSGRYYSQLSSVGVIGTGNTSTSINGATSIVNPTNTNNFKYGELLYVSSSENKDKIDSGATKNISLDKIYITDEKFFKMYNSLRSTNSKYTIDFEGWKELWEPQLKVFDSLYDSSASDKNAYYKKSSIKEYLYGIYLGGNNNIPLDGVVMKETSKKIDSFGNIKIRRFQNNINLKEYTSSTTATKYILFVFKDEYNNTESDYAFLDSLFGVTGRDTTNVTKYLKGFKLQNKIDNPIFYPNKEFGATEDNNFKDKTESINLTDKGNVIVPASKLDLNAFTETLNYFYRDTALNLIDKGNFTLKDEQKDLFNITGFVLVPRLADRRDEPTIYPLYKYWGGAKKKIEPSEILKYFEGQTYNTWKSKMTVNVSSTEEDMNWFYKEKERLSKYLRAYLEHFEAYVPYNIISDSDLEIRGSAGYGDLMTNYTLTPEYTKKYSQYFLNEANKSYWSDFIKRYDVTAKDVAQLLQGMAEISLQTAAEDSLNILRATSDAYDKSKKEGTDILKSLRNSRYIIEDATNEFEKEKPADSQENLAILEQAIISSIEGGNPIVNLTTMSGGVEEYYLPIVGLCAIDDSRENTAEIEDKNTIDVKGISDFTNFTFIGNFSEDFKNSVLAEAGSSKNTIKFYNDETATISTIQSKIDFTKEKDKQGFVVMLGANDVLKETSASIKTDKYRNLIYSIIAKNPNADIYIVKYPGFANYDTYNYEDEANISSSLKFKNGEGITKLSPTGYNASAIYNDYTKLNEVMNRYNTVIETTLNSINNPKIHILDFSSIYGNGISGISDTYVTDNIYFNDSKTTFINGENTKTDLYSSIKTEIFGSYFGREIGVIENNVKSTRTLNPISEDLEGFEVDLTITKGNNDGRLDKQKSVEFMSMRLFKLASSFNDILKGVYAYYCGTDFVNSLVTVTADNAINLREDPEHGLWYNPTINDISRALGKKLDASKEKELNSRFGIQRVKDSFSYITEIDNRKNLVVGAMKSISTVLGQKPGINVPNKYAYEFDLQNYIKNGDENGQWKYTNEEGYLEDKDKTHTTYFNGIDTSMRSITGEMTDEDTGIKLSYVQHVKNGTWGTPESKAIAKNAQNDGEFWYVEEDGVRYYLIALGLAYTSEDGSEAKSHRGGKFIVTTDEGNSFYAMVFDIKSPVHTDDANVISIMDGPDDHGVLRGLNNENIINGCAVEMQAYTNDVDIKKYRTPEGEAISGAIISIVPVDKANSGSSSNSRDYTEELFEEEYLKYQNTGLIEYVNHMHGDDIDNLISSTANYRNNNQLQVEEGYTYLDFFKNIEKAETSGENQFTGKQTDSLLLNAMTYLGAHYSQGRAKDVTKSGVVISRFANADNLTAKQNSSLPQFGFSTWPYGGSGTYYQEGANYKSNVEGMYGMDCSSFGSMMYIAMGYEFINSTCAGLRSGFTNYPGNDVTAEVSYDINNLKPGDLIITTTHTMIWMGDYAVNFGNLFNESTLKIKDSSLYYHTGSEVLAYANSLAGKKVYIHEGGFKKGKSCVNISEAYSSILTKNNAKVYRIFFDDVEYTKKAMEENQIIQPKIFTSTTIKNNPYLVEYMESAGILEEKLNTGLFTAEDISNARKMIAEAKGQTYIDNESSQNVSTN